MNDLIADLDHALGKPGATAGTGRLAATANAQ